MSTLGALAGAFTSNRGGRLGVAGVERRDRRELRLRDRQDRAVCREQDRHRRIFCAAMGAAGVASSATVEKTNTMAFMDLVSSTPVIFRY